MNILVCRLHQLTDFCHILPLSTPYLPLILRLSFAHPSLKVRWEEL
ncbi:hypothetical protein [Capnocytophaga sp. oral taxon 332]|nr:hypothetical protein [Capnocytophaga sp. oral taxon 332]